MLFDLIVQLRQLNFLLNIYLSSKSVYYANSYYIFNDPTPFILKLCTLSTRSIGEMSYWSCKTRAPAL